MAADRNGVVIGTLVNPRRPEPDYQPIRLATRPAWLAGREDLLAELDARLTAGMGRSGPSVVALYGMSGAGKTSAAVEYAYRQLAAVSVCWQFPAENPEVLASAFAELAAQLGVRDIEDARDPVASVHGVLAGREASWLLVFDNAPDLAAIERFLPPAGHGRVLITTRDGRDWQPGQATEVPVLGRDTAADFLVDRTGDPDRAAAGDLAAEMGGLPLALEQAGAYIRTHGLTMGDYLSLFRTRRADLLARGHPRDREPVAVTMGITLTRLAEKAPAAAGLLRVLAFLAPEPVPVDLLFSERAAGLLSPEVAAAVGPLLGDPIAIHDAADALRSYSLVSTPGKDRLLVHRLVQATICDQLTADQVSRWQRAAAVLTTAAIPEGTEPPASWPAVAALLPHAQVILDRTTHGPLPDAHLAVLRDCAVSLLRWCAQGLFHDDLRRDPFLPYNSVREMISPAAVLIRAGGCEDQDARLIAAALLGDDPPPGEFTVPALGFAYAQGLRVRLLPERVRAAVRHFGASRLSVRIARRRLVTDPAVVPAWLREALVAALMEFADRPPAALVINSVLADAGDTEQALDVLRPLAPGYEPVARRLANQLAQLGRGPEAEGVLTPWVSQSRQALLQYANLLADREQPAKAVALLGPLAGQEPAARVTLAGLLAAWRGRGEAIGVLRSHAGQHPDIAVWLARLLAEDDHAEEAMQVLEPWSGHHEQAATMCAELYLAAGQRDAAIKVLGALGSGFGSAGLRLADLHEQDDQLDEAIDVLRPLIRLVRPTAAMRLADLFLKTGQAGDAIAVLGEVAAEHAVAADRLAALLVADDRHTEAAEILWPHTPPARGEALELATQLASRGRVERAVNVLRPHAQTWDQAAMRAAGLLIRRDRPEEAAAILKPLARSSEQACLQLVKLLHASGGDDTIDELRDYACFPSVAAFLAQRLRSAHQPEDAVRLLRPLADQHEVTAVALADLLAAGGHHEEAIRTLTPLADRYQRAATRLADLQLAAGRRDAAITALRPLAGRYEQPAVRLCELLAEDGHAEEAIEILRPLAERFPEAARRVALLMAGQDRTPEAIELLTPLAGCNPAAATAAARLLAEASRPDDAVALLSPLTANPDITLALAGLQLRRGATSEVISMLRGRPGGLRDIRLKALLGAALLLAGDRIAGLDQFNQVSQARGQVAHGYRAACSVLADLGRDDILGVLVNWRGGDWPMSEVVAGCLPRLLLNRPGRTSARTVVRGIWSNNQVRGMTVRELTAALRVWAAGPPAGQPALRIVSYLEVLLHLGAGQNLRAPVVAKLASVAAASAETRESLARYAAVSPVAADVADGRTRGPGRSRRQDQRPRPLPAAARPARTRRPPPGRLT